MQQTKEDVNKKTPPTPNMPNNPKEKAKKGTTKRLFSYIAKNKYMLWGAVVLAVVSTVFVTFGPLILGNVTTVISDGAIQMANNTGGIDFEKIGKMLLGLSMIYVLAQIFSYLQIFIMTKISQDSVYHLRKDVNEKLNRLPLNYFDTNTHGEILSKITNDIETINSSLQQTMTQMITSIVSIIGIVAIMFFINVWMTLIALLVIPLSFFLSIGLVKKSQKYFTEQQASLGDVNGHVEEMYGGHTVIKVFNREKFSIEKLKSINNKLYGSFWKSQFFSNIMFPMVAFAGNLGYVALSVVGAVFALNGVITIGNIQSFIQYIRNFIMPIGQISQSVSILQSTIAAADRVFKLLDEKEEIKEENLSEFKEAKGDVTFEHVKFGYINGKILINDCSIQVKSGQKVAIVGPTGAGKTTLINLLMRFYDVSDGSIKVDGIDIRDVKRDNLRKIYGMVLQDTWLFNGTIKENINYGNLDASEADVMKAAKLACADHFIHTMPNGYDMVINEEASNLSGGQKQLLTIARAILSNPRILILDEATSSVDTRTEILIQKAMVNLMKGRTSFVIAHRLSTIKDADMILVMRDGDIIETGTHDELISQKGFYENLYNSQFAEKAV